MSSLSFNQEEADTFDHGGYVSFVDFIIQYHKIPHYDLSMINKIEFTMKKRSLIHQVCFNIHIHLLECLLNIRKDDVAHVTSANQLDYDTGSEGEAHDEMEQKLQVIQNTRGHAAKPQQ